MPQDRFSPSTRFAQPSPVPDAADADDHLLREVAGGSNESLGLFYDRHASLVLGFLCRMLGDRNEAEEILQEVFLQVWRDARRYDRERSSPRGWLLLIARSRALDRRRATVSRRRGILREGPISPAGSAHPASP
jgi:RNA polymerase sigma-70 factor (ECF subfamily)